ncbi:MAG: hypothetical protein LBH25_14115 [Fibromonadaceae bacterium]|jgi:hypothetical protein|nr:hypothetical protein [Fibromonadaceae bacterium]
MGKNLVSGITVVNLAVAIVFIFATLFVIFYKIFAVSAHLKAMEVNLQVGRWNKMHLIYALETEKLGSFKDIGFIPQGEVAKDGEASKGPYFNYSSDLLNGKGRFLAVNRVGLDACKKYDGQWFAYINPEQIIGNAVAEAPIKRCAELTPDFELLRDFL